MLPTSGTTPANDLSRKASKARTGLIVVMLLAIVSALSTAEELALLLNAQAGQFVSMEQATAIDSRQTLIGLLYLIAFVVSAVLFIRWQRAAYDHAVDMDPEPLPYSRKWTIWGWIVPILFIWVPYRIVKAIYRRACRSTSASIVGWWWFAWITTNLLANMSLRASMQDSLYGLTLSSATSLASDLLDIPAGLLAIKVIRDITGAAESEEGVAAADARSVAG